MATSPSCRNVKNMVSSPSFSMVSNSYFSCTILKYIYEVFHLWMRKSDLWMNSNISEFTGNRKFRTANPFVECRCDGSCQEELMCIRKSANAIRLRSAQERSDPDRESMKCCWNGLSPICVTMNLNAQIRWIELTQIQSCRDSMHKNWWMEWIQIQGNSIRNKIIVPILDGTVKNLKPFYFPTLIRRNWQDLAQTKQIIWRRDEEIVLIVLPNRDSGDVVSKF